MEKHDGFKVAPVGNPENGIQGLFIGQVSPAPHDSLLEELRAITFDLHRPIVIRLECQHVYSAEELDEFIRYMPKVSCKPDSLLSQFEPERRAATDIMRNGDGMNLETAFKLHVVGEHAEAFLWTARTERCPGMSWRDMNRDLHARKGSSPGGVEMIPIQVCQEYMVNGTEVRPQFPQLAPGPSHGEPQVDENLAGCAMLLCMEEGTVAAGTAAEVHQVESWTTLSVDPVHINPVCAFVVALGRCRDQKIR